MAVDLLNGEVLAPLTEWQIVATIIVTAVLGWVWRFYPRRHLTVG